MASRYMARLKQAIEAAEKARKNVFSVAHRELTGKIVSWYADHWLQKGRVVSVYRDSVLVRNLRTNRHPTVSFRRIVDIQDDKSNKRKS